MRTKTRGERNAEWIESMCCVPEGRLVGQKLKLTKKQREWLKLIYDSPTRMFILSVGRKNAKTAFAAMIVLLHLVGTEAVANSQIPSIAQSRDQAGILFSLAAKMVRMSRDLSQYVQIRESKKQLLCPELGTVYTAFSADAQTTLGFSPAVAIVDELGQVRGARSELYEAIDTASAAHEKPLTIIISTQAPTDGDLLSILIDDALTGADPTIKCVLYSAPIDLDPFSLEAIRAANPHYDDFMNKDEVLRQASNAKRMPSSEAAYRNLILNQRVQGTNPFITRSVWEENGLPPSDLKGQVVYGGLDLSSTSDLTALVLVSEYGDIDCRFWLPEEGLAEKSRTDRVPYDIWHRDEYLLTTSGRAIEYEYIAYELRNIFNEYDVRSIAFDRYNMKFLRSWLEKVGFTEDELERFVEFGQGFVSMSPAIRELEARLLQKQLKHGKHPVLSMCAANAVTTSDPAGNRKFIKSKSTGRIDGMVALAMAIGVMPNKIEDDDLSDFFSNPIIV